MRWSCYVLNAVLLHFLSEVFWGIALAIVTDNGSWTTFSEIMDLIISITTLTVMDDNLQIIGNLEV